MFITNLKRLTSSTNRVNIKVIINPSYPHSRKTTTNDFGQLRKIVAHYFHFPSKEKKRCERLTVLHAGNESSEICTLESSLSREPFLIALICSSN